MASDGPVLVKVSGASTAALYAQADRLASFVETTPSVELAGIAWTAGVGRADLSERAAVVARSRDELVAGLRAVAAGTGAPGVARGRRAPGAVSRLALLAPGQGMSAVGLLAGVYGRVPVVTEVLDSLSGVLGAVTELPLAVLLHRGREYDNAFADTGVAQPALYALAVALGTWWRSVGVTPELLLGHSVGAYAAAALAGVFSIEDGARLVAERGRLMDTLAHEGAMTVVLAPACDVADLPEVRSNEVEVAVYNGPRSTVLSGPETALSAVGARLTERGIRLIRLPVSRAFHSAQMEPVLEPLGAAIADIPRQEPTCGLVSDSSGDVVGIEVTTVDYWVRHTRQPVRFAPAVRTLLTRRVTTLVELGSGALLPAAASTAADQETPLRCVPTLPGRIDPHEGMMATLGRLWVDGASVDWTAVHPRPDHPTALPTYAFQRTTHWSPPTDRRPPAATSPSPAGREAPPAPPRPTTVPDRPRVGELIGWLRQELAALELDAVDLDPDIGLFDLGLTSTMVVELRDRLERRIGREIPATAVFDHPTIGRLAAFLAAEPGPPISPAQRRGATAEPLAIVGMACRFPGGANDLAAFWRLLAEGRDAIGDVPDSRWGLTGADPAGATLGGFLDVPVDEFDADAFGISPREARSMDPQQRLLLEVAHEAVDDAGCTSETLERSTTSVFVGITTSDYMQLLAADGAAGIDGYQATGNTFSVAAGRLSYLLGASGPAMAVDTACSSSLVAAHLAARSLRSGESDLAVVAGVNLMLSPNTTVSLAKMNALSPDGRCKTFDASADGYVRGEGCGVVVLKRLSDAEAAGDRIWALLRGTAVNQDGRSAGLTVPNGQAQRRVIGAALCDAGVSPDAIGYVEAHGTGTPLGDPMELGALAEALRPGDLAAPALVVGSVKTNVGHLEAAAGVCGLIKVALMLHHRRLPPNLHFRQLNPHVRADALPVAVPTELAEWATGDSPRMAGVSSFGFSGTNAHVVLAEAPAQVSVAPDPGAEQTAGLLVVSASTAAGRDATAAAYAEFLRETDTPAGVGWRDIVRTAAVHRRQLPYRAAVVAHSRAEAAQRLAGAGVRIGRAASPDDLPRLLFVYNGQGSQWPAMGVGLLADPTARAALESYDEAVRKLAGWSLLDVLTAPQATSRLDDTVYAQPAIFAVQAALTATWRQWGVVPDAVVGHSVGEIAAAHTAGALDLDTALRIVVRRAEVMAQTRGSGAMAVVGLPVDVARALMRPFADRLHVAAINSPVNTVVAGDPAALDELRARVRERGAFHTIINPHYAFHTPLMAPAADELVDAVGDVTPGPTALAAYSTVHGALAGSDAFTAAYWAGNVLRPVRFLDAVLAAAGPRTTVVEVGPDAVLGTAVTQSLADRSAATAVLASMRAGRDPREVMLDAAAGLYVGGHVLDHAALGAPGRPVPIPHRQWVRSRHWLPARPGRVAGATAGSLDQALARDVYEIGWRPRKLAERVREQREPAGDTWVLVADHQGIAERVVVRLSAAGQTCHVVATDAGAVPDPEADRARLAAVLTTMPSVSGVIHLGALDAGAVDSPGTGLDEALAVSCGPLLAAPGCLAGYAGGRSVPRLWTVTRGGVAAGTAPAALPQTPAWGLGRVVALEHPDIWGGLIDLDPLERDPDAAAAAIVAELLDTDGEDQVAYRAGERLVARLQRAAPLLPADDDTIDAASAYLITGGRGALGLRIAQRLARRGARHLVLLGRRPLSEQGDRQRRAQAVLRQLTDAGVTIHLPDADVADASAMAAIFDTASTPWPAIRGVVHAAGVFDTQPVDAMTWERFREVLRSKVEGTLVLDALTGDRDLDFFVMFSSASSVWGSALAGHYVAANYFQDVMAHDRIRRGLPGLSINWGWWGDSDMAAHHADYFQAMGLSVLPDEEGLEAFDRLLRSSRVQTTIAPVDWTRFRPVLEARRTRPLLADIDAGTVVTAAPGADTVLLDRLAKATPAGRVRLVEELVRRETAAVLGRETDAPLDRDLGFFAAGMDSITSVELKVRLESVLGVRLPTTAAFEHPTVAELAAFLLSDLLAPLAPTADPATDGIQDGPGDVSAELTDLPEDELLRLLEAELEEPG